LIVYHFVLTGLQWNKSIPSQTILWLCVLNILDLHIVIYYPTKINESIPISHPTVISWMFIDNNRMKNSVYLTGSSGYQRNFLVLVHIDWLSACCYNLKLSNRNFKIYWTRLRLKNYTARAYHIYIYKHVSYRRQLCQNCYITPFLRLHLHDSVNWLYRYSYYWYLRCIWVFLMIFMANLRGSLHDIWSIFPGHLFEGLSMPFNQVL